MDIIVGPARDEDCPKKEFATKENEMLKGIFRIRIELKWTFMRSYIQWEIGKTSRPRFRINVLVFWYFS